MPKLINIVPRYRLHKRSGQAIVTLNGQMHYLGPWRSPESLEKYNRLTGEWLARNRQPSPPSKPVTVFTINDLILRFALWATTYYTRDGQPTGEMAPLKLALKVLKNCYGQTAAAEFDSLRLEAVREKMIENGWVRTSINAHIHRLKRMFRWAGKKKLVPAQVWLDLLTVESIEEGKNAKESEPAVPVSDEVVLKTLPHLGPVVREMVKLQLVTGMRSGELVRMRPNDIERKDDVWVYKPIRHKLLHRKKVRQVVLGPKAQAILEPLLHRQAGAYCFSPADNERARLAELHLARKTPLHRGNRPGSNRRTVPKRTKGQQYTTLAYARAIARACKKANVEHWHPHQLRHSFATMIADQCDTETASVLLGHFKLSTTEGYVKRNLARAAAVAKTLG